jgi:hypothetical protein
MMCVDSHDPLFSSREGKTMKGFIGLLCVAALVTCLGSQVGAQGSKDVDAILDKAIKALGGEQALSAVKAATWKGKGKITFGGSDNDFSIQGAVQGLEHFRQEFEGEFDGNKIKGLTVLNGDKAWRVLADMSMELDKDGVANEKRNVYLLLIPAKVLPLKGKAFKVEVAPEENVAGKPAAGLKITPPDGKIFKLYFDKDSGLPVKQVAAVVGFGGDEFTQETTFSNYKDINGLKKAMKVENKRDGEKFMAVEFTEYKLLDKVDPKLFAQPQ